MRLIATLALTFFAALTVAPAATHKAKTPPKKHTSTAKHPVKTPSAKKKTGRSTAPVHRARGKSTKGRATSRNTHAVSRPPAAQGNPSSSRYVEIQEALAAKGYLKTQPTGVWDQDSVDAMKRFQADQKLATTGKLNSLSLIALGLGPKPTAPPETAPH